jgi:hypothetical protein
MCNWLLFFYNCKPEYGCFELFPFRQFFGIFVRLITWFRWTNRHWTSGVNVHNKNSNRCADLTFDPQLKTFSVKDRYQLTYFICIKDFNAETNTSLKLNLFSFFICGCHVMSASSKENDLPLCMYFWYQTYSGVPNTNIYSAVSLASPYYNYL